jgi:hypothetical protein
VLETILTEKGYALYLKRTRPRPEGPGKSQSAAFPVATQVDETQRFDIESPK